MSTSQWSSTNSLTTKASYVPVYENGFLSPTNGANSRFGTSVAISDDGNYIIVGARTDLELSQSGAVYIFFKSGATWTQQAKLKSGSTAINGFFGASVDIDATGTRCVVSSHISGGYNYVFLRTGTSWTLEASFFRSGRSSTDYEVKSSISGDGATIITGSYGYNGYTGLATIYTRVNTTWTQKANLTGSGVVANDAFGYDVSINSNGTYAIVGTQRGPVFGFAFIYVYTTSWTLQSKIIPSDSKNPDGFGISVDINGAGDRVIIGAPSATAPTYQGKAYIYTRSGTTWTQEATLVISDGANDPGGPGRRVSMSRDGSSAIIAGYAAPVSGLSNAGKSFLFTRSGTTWTQRGVLTASNPTANAYYGYGLAISADGLVLIIGAADYSSNIGRVYINT